MRFLFTMHMPSFGGHPVHQIIGDHPANSLEDLVEEIGNSDFIIISEIYKDDGNRTKLSNPDYFQKGDVSLNCMHIGKVKVFTL